MRLLLRSERNVRFIAITVAALTVVFVLVTAHGTLGGRAEGRDLQLPSTAGGAAAATRPPSVQTVTFTLPSRHNRKAVMTAAPGRWRSAVASAYSARSTGSTRQGCPHAPPLTDRALSVATFLVRCGARLRLCAHRRCVTVTRTDSGPFAAGRSIDVNVGAVRALGFRDEWAWGVRRVAWRRVP